MTVGVGKDVDQELGEVTAEHLLEPRARRERLRVWVTLNGCGLGC